MKNLFLIPTPAETRVAIKSDGLLFLTNHPYPNSPKFANHHIYITNDEKFIINEFITDGIEVIKASSKLVNAQGLVDRRNWRKITVTTDLELIKNGVQSIPDEFLEWFVKNPSCEWVEVEQPFNPSSMVYGINTNPYKIIIPKEEPKQPKTFKELFANTNIEPTTDESGNIHYNFKATKKQETLEEAAERLYPTTIDSFTDSGIDLSERDRIIFTNGSKWQQEQDKNSYSEEEVIKLLHKRDEHMNTYDKLHGGFQTPKEWFEQFKKK